MTASADVMGTDDIEEVVIGMNVNGLRIILEWMLMNTAEVIELGDFARHRTIRKAFSATRCCVSIK